VPDPAVTLRAHLEIRFADIAHAGRFGLVGGAAFAGGGTRRAPAA
jgi:hypothetical protein